jgi:hypothetical protein
VYIKAFKSRTEKDFYMLYYSADNNKFYIQNEFKKIVSLNENEVYEALNRLFESKNEEIT